MANNLHPTAVKIVNSENELNTSRTDKGSAQEAYDQAALAAQQADTEAAAKQAAEQEACAGLGLPPLALPTPAPTPPGPPTEIAAVSGCPTDGSSCEGWYKGGCGDNTCPNGHIYSPFVVTLSDRTRHNN